LRQNRRDKRGGAIGIGDGGVENAEPVKDKRLRARAYVGGKGVIGRGVVHVERTGCATVVDGRGAGDALVKRVYCAAVGAVFEEGGVFGIAVAFGRIKKIRLGP